MPRFRMAALIMVITAVFFAAQYFYPRQSVAEEPLKFTSREQLAEYIKSNSLMAQMFYGQRELLGLERTALPAADGRALQKSAAAGPPAASAEAYSTTNIQVEGVDEEDIIKNDGRYLYTVSGRQVHIIEAYPAEKAKLVSTINTEGYPSGIYLSGEKLVVIGRRINAPGTIVSVYDIKDRARPAEVRTLAWEGGCVSSRMMGNNVYLVLTMPVGFDGQDVNLPRLTENGEIREVSPDEIYYFDCPDRSYMYTMIVSVNAADDSQQSVYRTFLTGVSQNVFASTGNIYLTGVKTPDMASLVGRFIEGLASLVSGEAAEKIRNTGTLSLTPGQKIARAEQVLEEYMAGMDYAGAADLEEKIGQLRGKFYREMARERDKTVICKFALQGSGVEYRCRGEVNGLLLNQFSMDEEGDYFRVATTSQGFLLSDRPVTRNNIYVLGQDLNLVGKLEGLAPTERIYSARFMGSRVYMVTFRRVDPLFVIDLKDPQNPTVLGELKIPGFSDYLHPYDENHLIGVGKEVDAPAVPVPMPSDPGLQMTAPEFMPPLPVRQQGVKIALFDVSNPAKPVEISKCVAPFANSDSEVSRNHKAFLFSRDKNLMALPVTYVENLPAYKEGGLFPRHRSWQGMFVFNINLQDGISLKGKINHPATGDIGYEAVDPVRRAAYINDAFYTVSDGAVKASRIDNLREIKTVILPRDTKYFPGNPRPLVK